jgi:hypothetical protein
MHNQQCSITMRHKTRCSPFMNVLVSHPVSTLRHAETDLMFYENRKSAWITKKSVQKVRQISLTEDTEFRSRRSGLDLGDRVWSFLITTFRRQWEVGVRFSAVVLSLV